MFFKKPLAAKAKQRVDSLIGDGVKIEGNVSFDGGFEVNGSIVGNISGKSDDSLLIIGKNASIHGEVSAGHIVVSGNVQGPIIGRQSVLVRNTGRVTGDIRYGCIQMEEGASVDGHLVCVSLKSDENLEEIGAPACLA